MGKITCCDWDQLAPCCDKFVSAAEIVIVQKKHVQLVPRMIPHHKSPEKENVRDSFNVSTERARLEQVKQRINAKLESLSSQSRRIEKIISADSESEHASCDVLRPLNQQEVPHPHHEKDVGEKLRKLDVGQEDKENQVVAKRRAVAEKENLGFVSFQSQHVNGTLRV